jgi:nucleoside-diphosphate-sugar epimerase
MRASEIPVLYGSYDKAQSLLGWKPKFSLKETLTEVYNYWLNNLDGNKK